MSEEQLEVERDYWRKQAIGVQEMLAQVLLVVGEPVVISKELAHANLNGLEIKVDLDPESESFTFSMVEKEADENPVPDGP